MDKGGSSEKSRARELLPPAVEASGLLSRILDTADDAIISVDSEHRVQIFNQGAERIFGYRRSEIIGEKFDCLIPKRFHRAHSTHVKDFEENSTSARMMGERGEILGCRKDGTEFPAEASISKVEVSGDLLMTVILRDVTVRRQADARIRAALQEKEVLLQEVHHRVKNNLQIVSSLLNLQARSAHDEDVRRVFQESRHRVHSMALIHEQLYRSEDLSDVSFDAYVGELTEILFRSYRADPNKVRLTMELDRVSLGLDSAVPCGLILNELVTNSLKHAFPEDREGEIQVRLEAHADSSISLCVIDDGVGVPESVGFWNTNSLGWKLVRTLVRQLDGEVDIDGPPGTRVGVRFAPPLHIEENA